MIDVNNQQLTLVDKIKLFFAILGIIAVIYGTYLRVQKEKAHKILFEQYEKEHFQNLEKNERN